MMLGGRRRRGCAGGQCRGYDRGADRRAL